MTVDRESLGAWYRLAMRDRVAELESLRKALAREDAQAVATAHALGHSLRGSGATFGFPEISEAGTLLEAAAPEDLCRRTEGVLTLLRTVAWPDDAAGHSAYAWVAWVAGVTDDTGLGDTLDEAWACVASRSGLDDEALAARIAARFGLAAASSLDPSRTALRLVPPALMREHLLLPLDEDGERIGVATANPVDLASEAALQRVTGRLPVFHPTSPAALRQALDRVLGPDEAPAPERKARAAVEASKILIVDDDASIRLLARAVMERKGHRVVEAADAEAAFEIVEADPDLDLAVVDLNLPGMGGDELVRRLRTSERGRAIAIVVLTGSQDPEREADLIEAGADDYLRKPLDPRLFAARVASTLRRARA